MKNLIYIILIIVQYQVAIGQGGEIHISNDKLYGELRNGFPEKDTIVELKKNEIVVGKGSVAMSKYGVSDLKIGYWKEYYENGILKMEGDYRLGSYLNCCVDGTCRSFHYYRTGLWKFYNEKGELNYELQFEPKELQIHTNCEGGDKLLFGLIQNIPLKYMGDLTSENIFEFQRIKKEDEDIIEIWTPLNGIIFIDIKIK